MGLKGTLELNAMVGFYLNESLVLRMLARVPIISTCSQWILLLVSIGLSRIKMMIITIVSYPIA